MKNKPIIGITMGDPASIGPELTLKALSRYNIYERCAPVVIGDAAILDKAKEILGKKELRIHPVKDVKEALFSPGVIDVLDLGLADPNKIKPGEVSAMAGEAAFQYVKKVIELAMDKKIAATVTNAISKEAINLAGHHYSGHTEIYADLTGTKKYTMMLAYKDLRVVHVSTHVSLREACDRVKQERILEVIEIANKACIEMGISSPVIGVAGLNPHCGENGLFGMEEQEEIIPAIKEAKLRGFNAQGPIPPDSIFSKARGGFYDIVVAMYHDQGHIPLKVLGFVYNKDLKKWDSVEGVNITLGLPIIRTSVDHGTAFDQAYTGLASEFSLVNAMDYAISFAGGNI
ncbi:4-hydroxythreonine-4-phosphate dehydrogenase PdxA [Anaerocolumna sp. MB42-C2]|nr:4-hydroxythreonine-4-phosphate dehydrogenase PdxA [Anaerocolumna sp. MB42-C2]WMJ85780.1 4-hydroxythreonine-4-phosphate dehydrogenase PdxA [Anaerocolumna sp. MB42-C2]